MTTSEGKTPDALRRQFLEIFHQIARHKHRYDVFRDFVTLAATALHNGAVMDEARETEYVTTTGGYAREDIEGFPKLLAILVELLQPEPRDILGPLYMELDIASREQGQFFTPPELSDLMAQMTFGPDLLKPLETAPFITVSEPACGAGGMILSLVKVLIEEGHDPAGRLWAHCVDVNRLAALMCYVQLSLWNVPAEIVVGNSLTLETREVWHTPAHHLGFWGARLARRDAQAGQGGASPAPAKQETPPTPSQSEPTEDSAPSFDVQLPGQQMDFGF